MGVASLRIFVNYNCSLSVDSMICAGFGCDLVSRPYLLRRTVRFDTTLHSARSALSVVTLTALRAAIKEAAGADDFDACAAFEARISALPAVVDEFKDRATAKELVAAGMTAEYLRAAAMWTAGDLKQVGFTASEMMAARFSVGDLKAAKFSLAELKAAKISLAGLKAAMPWRRLFLRRIDRRNLSRQRCQSSTSNLW